MAILLIKHNNSPNYEGKKIRQKVGLYVSFNKEKLRAAVFIDHSNIASPLLEPNCRKHERIDYKKLKDVLFQGYKEGVAIMFMGVMDPMRPEKEKFMKYLEKIDFVLMRVPLMKRKDGTFEQKQLDILMHEMMVSYAEANEFDVAILVSGDADFVVAAQIIKNMNKDVLVWSWKKSISLQLLETVGEGNVFYIDDIWNLVRKK
ncbi:MAG: NYN domain-containing protein [Candidatus Thorarchaeota archaeon]